MKYPIQEKINMRRGTSLLNRITINKPNQQALSYDESLGYLITSLDLSYRLWERTFLQSLCEIAIEIYKDTDAINANKILRKKYVLPNLELPPVITTDGTKNLLFTTNALRLLHLLLSCQCTLSFTLFPRVISGQNPKLLE